MGIKLETIANKVRRGGKKIAKKRTLILAVLFGFFVLFFGASLGASLAVTYNTINTENFVEFTSALPTKVLDINGELVTEFAADERRELITLDKLPQHLLDALITREDRVFYEHKGFSARAIIRAVLGKLTGRSLGGGSTLTQQIAGTLYTNRSEMSLKRKLKELWWAIQMERRYSKNEILEIYLNKIFFGAGTYGVNAASKHYFGHGAETITPAESAILVVQLSNPAHYNPFEHTNRAMDRQKSVLSDMARFGYLAQEEADFSFENFWLDFDYTRTNASAFTLRIDMAPWFSEYVRREVTSMVYGTHDIYTDGFVVNTTLNLAHQNAAQETMDYYIKYANDTYKETRNRRISSSLEVFIPVTELLTLAFNLEALKAPDDLHRIRSVNDYNRDINPVVDAFSMMLGITRLKQDIVNEATSQAQAYEQKSTIEGTLISVENETGYITSLIGGGKYDKYNQYIRAIQARIQPGSSFKPLYYSAAIDSRIFTAATPIDDVPVVFYNEVGKPYIPENFMGRWAGTVQFWYALATSMNVPSLQVLKGIGFDAAINRAVALLGIPDEEVPRRAFDRVFPLGLGTCTVRPVELARAYAIFANQGREVTPFAVRSVQDRNGKVILNPEADVKGAIQSHGTRAQIISPQTAWIMTSILQKTTSMGTLAASTEWGNLFRYKTENGRTFTMPSAGKTGTTQNWADAWAAGFTPYITAIVWFGFDKSGETLGLNLTGSTLAGPAWGKFMKAANSTYPEKNFPVPESGLIHTEVCSVSGMLPTAQCGNNLTVQYFLTGTQPTTPCETHAVLESNAALGEQRLREEYWQYGGASSSSSDSPLMLDLSWLGTSETQNTDDELFLDDEFAFFEEEEEVEIETE